MMSVPFGALYAVPSRNGVSVPKGDRSSGVQMINMGELFKFQRIGDSEMARVPLSAGELVRSLVAPGDLLFARRSLQLSGAGRCALVVESSEPRTFESSIIRVRLDMERACPEYYFYFFTSGAGRQVMETIVEQAVVAGIRASDLRNLGVPMPPVTEQRGIAATLGALDGKIDSNRRLIGTIEQLGSTLLESRLGVDVYGFPDYDQQRRVGDVLDVFETGSRPKGGVDSIREGVVSLGAENIQSAGVSSASRYKLVPQEFAQAMRRGRLEHEDVLVYKDGGRPGSFTPHVSAFGWGFPTPEATINEHVYRVRASGGISQALLYWVLRSSWMNQEMRKRGTGVAIPGLNSSNFRDLPLPIIHESALADLNAQLGPMLSAMLRLGSVNGRLAELRNTLLPELLSGRIRVPEAHEIVAEAAG